MRSLRKTRLCVSGMLVFLAVGCTQPESRHDQLMQSSAGLPAVDRRIDNHQWVKRLVASPPLENVQQASAMNGATAALPIPLPQSVAATGVGYSLVVDNQRQLAWLQSYGGAGGQVQKLSGPWKLDHPDVALLLHSVTIPPTQPVAIQ